MENIKVAGKLKLTMKDLNGNILSVDEDSNLILNSGLTSLCNLLVGNISLPSDISAGTKLYQSYKAMPYLPLYIQFGTRATPPQRTDIPPYDNGTLDPNTISPAYASEIIKTTFYSSSSNSITLKVSLPGNLGNGSSGQGLTFREAVLMSKEGDTPIKFSWFARRVFGDKIKTPLNTLEAEWTFTFTAGSES